MAPEKQRDAVKRLADAMLDASKRNQLADALLDAAKRNRLADAIALIDARGVDPNHRDREGQRTALFWAAHHGHHGLLQALLARRANPNIGSDVGITPAMLVSCGDHPHHLEMLQLLAIHGADIEAVSMLGHTARVFARSRNRSTILSFLDAIKNWTPFRIAIGCRLPTADLKRMLKNGTIDPSDCSLAELAAVGGTPANTLWPGSPGPCDAMTALVRAAMASWSPDRHSLHHPGVRSGVLTTLLVARRLQSRHAVVCALTQHQLQTLPQSSALIGLPNELWLVVCSFFRRSDWVV